MPLARKLRKKKFFIGVCYFTLFSVIIMITSFKRIWHLRQLVFIKGISPGSLVKSRGAYHLTEKSGWGVESIMVSDLPVYHRNATSVTVWIPKKGEFVSRVSGTEKELRNWLMVSNIPFGSYQPEWTDYLKIKRTPQFSVGIFEKWPYHLPSIRNFPNFPSNG